MIDFGSQFGSQFGLYMEAVRDRLVEAQKEYGTSALTKDTGKLIDEIEEEALDIAGWGFWIHLRIQGLRHKLESLEDSK